MKEVIVSKGLIAEIVDSPVPEPKAGEVLIKIVVTGTNPKDWKRPEKQNYTGNQGDDMAGVVEKVGSGVTEFHPGDRVAAFHRLMTPHGSYAEYGIAPADTTFHIPDKISFEEAATLPLAALTSVFALYKDLALPDPWNPRQDTDAPLPLIIYGASTAIGTFAVQLARRSNIHPIIGIAGASSKLVLDLMGDGVSKYGDAVVDYRQSEEGIIADVKKAVAAAAKHYPGYEDKPESIQITRAYDPMSYDGGYITLGKILQGPDARLAVVAPTFEYKELEGRAEPLHLGKTFVGQAHEGTAAERDLGYVYSRYLGRGLQEGWLRGHPYEVVPGGLNGIRQALVDLKEGKNHGVKYVLRIAETEGL
ncbi:hypothetical protein SEUCBS140593_007707 [Sporothrix eucalyptigena]|uniref:Enoyl reductase (ER) domain-containing protein n=1 Tax=Sporothrix eucalyptigena TaxID=1812306 RepID=A0ABP0CFE2_9PEZI